MTGLEKICSALAEAGIRYALVGGHAVALHGAVRGTVDIDVVLAWSRRSLVAAEKALSDLGLVSRLPVSAGDIYEFRDEFIEKRNLVAWKFYDPGDLSLQVDIVINYDLKGKRTRKIKLANSTITVLSINDLITMKRRSGRPQDLEDVAALERLK